MNWFHKLMLVLTAFVSMMVYFAVRSVQTPLDLVTENYYQEELKHQDKMDKADNYARLENKVKISNEPGQLKVAFPTDLKATSLTGTVKLYYAGDKSKDAEMDLKLDETGVQIIDVSGRSGAYSVQVNWQSGQESYYTETKLFL